MAKTIAVHSFRRGAGKSSLAANLGALLARQGYRVGLLDADFQSPSLHIFFGLAGDETGGNLNGFLLGRYEIDQAVFDLTGRLDSPGEDSGGLLLLPASTQASDILQIIRGTHSFERLDLGLNRLSRDQKLEYLVVDIAAGLTEETLAWTALASTLLILLRPDPGDYQGTAVLVELARRLEVPEILMALNDSPAGLDQVAAQSELADRYQCEVGALIPHSEGLLSTASRSVLVRQMPADPYMDALRALAARITR